MTQDIERKVIELIATDRVEIPISSMSGKLKRRKPKLVQTVSAELPRDPFFGERVYARTESEDLDKARTLRDAVDEFKEEFPKYGAIIEGKIAEKRVKKETHLYFGINDGCRLTETDYMGVMSSLGFTPATARSLYPELIDVSRNMSKKRDEERRVLIGGNESEE